MAAATAMDADVAQIARSQRLTADTSVLSRACVEAAARARRLDEIR